MSRHRAVRNLDLDEELAEDSHNDFDFLDDLSPEDQDALEDALHVVFDTLGEPDECGFTERQMKEALWETYFDPEGAIDFLVQERERAEAQEKKRAGTLARQGEARRHRRVAGHSQQDASTDSDSLTPPWAPRPRRPRPTKRTHMATPIPPQGPAQPAPATAGGATPRDARASTTSQRPAASLSARTAEPAAAPAAAPGSSAGAPAKKLSKLQQKLLANKEKKDAADKAPGSALKGDAASALRGRTSASISRTSSPMSRSSASKDSQPSSRSATPTPVAMAPSGAPLQALFPTAAPPPPLSRFGQIVHESGSDATPAPVHGVPPAPSEDDIEQLRVVFSSLSPDDIVLAARQGTRLAR